jgi:hypothetical protein
VAQCAAGGGKAENNSEQQLSLSIRMIDESTFAVIQNNVVSLGQVHHIATSFFNS